MTTDLSVEKFFRNEVSQSKKILKDMSKKMDPDLTHDLRVSVRRIRTVFGVLESDHKKVISAKDKKKLKKLWKILSSVREADVAADIAKKFSMDEKQVVQHDEKIVDKFSNQIRKKKFKKLINHLNKIADDKSLRHVDPTPTIQTFLNEIDHLNIDPNHLHPLRIMLKKIRYFMEIVDLKQDEFKKYQDILGELNDLEMFAAEHGLSPEIEMEHSKQSKKAMRIVKPAIDLAVTNLKKAEDHLH